MKILTIKNFKCFKDISIPLNKLTLLAGSNGNGKSSVIQAFLLLRSTIESCAQLDRKQRQYNFLENRNLCNIELNGNYNLSLGNSDYIIPQGSDNFKIEFGLIDTNSSLTIEYGTKDTSLYIFPEKINEDEKVESFYKQEFYYLNAERLGPRIKQEIKYLDFYNTGFQGEYSAQIIGDTKINYTFKVDELRKYQDKTSPRLEQQISAWLDYLMPGVTISSSYSIETMSAQIMVSNHFSKGNPVLAPNIGFGISYVLPIVITGLIAEKGSFMVVENPEAHLHPSAQSKIGKFLAMVASAGVNVIIETHSDHVINGIQISAARNEILPEHIIINYFNQNNDESQPQLESISVNSKGELSSWPRGFFDQSQIDYAELFKLRKQ